jgi:hypothetical protein
MGTLQRAVPEGCSYYKPFCRVSPGRVQGQARSAPPRSGISRKPGQREARRGGAALAGSQGSVKRAAAERALAGSQGSVKRAAAERR